MWNDIWTILVFVMLLTSPGQEQAEPFEVLKALHQARTSTVSFELDGVDWAAAAPSWIVDATLPSRDSTLLARLTPLIDDYGFAPVTYPLPVPEHQTGVMYYLVYPDGVTAMQLDSLLGTARFRFNRAQNVAEDRIYYGYAYASSPDLPELRGGGFLLRTSDSLRFTTEPTSLTADDIFRREEAGEPEYWGRGTPYWDISTQFLIRLEGAEARWLFVQWAPDTEQIEAGCFFRYSLYRIPTSGRPKGLASMDYGCDV